MMNRAVKLDRFGVQVPADVGQRLRNAAAALGWSLAELMSSAVAERVTTLELVHNGGKPFPHVAPFTSAR